MSTLIQRNQDDIVIVYFQDVRIIDESRISALGRELNDLANQTTVKKIVLNFQNVSFMSSAMIGKLVHFAKSCKTAGVDLRLCDINENVGQVFSLMKLDKVFKIDSDESASVKAFSKKGWFG